MQALMSTVLNLKCWQLRRNPLPFDVGVGGQPMPALLDRQRRVWDQITTISIGLYSFNIPPYVIDEIAAFLSPVAHARRISIIVAVRRKADEIMQSTH
jgi:hypothetical protein